MEGMDSLMNELLSDFENTNGDTANGGSAPNGSDGSWQRVTSPEGNTDATASSGEQPRATGPPSA